MSDNPVGRPVKILFKDLNFVSDFKSEKDLQEYIETNIELFCRDILEDPYVSHKTDEPVIQSIRQRARGTKRIDLLVQCENSLHIIELKSGGGNNIRAGIGQLLDYGREFPYPTKKMVLLSSTFDNSTALTIEEYKLPITYITLRKAQTYIYQEAA